MIGKHTIAKVVYVQITCGFVW